jgi:hypothetical protein
VVHGPIGLVEVERGQPEDLGERATDLACRVRSARDGCVGPVQLLRVARAVERLEGMEAKPIHVRRQGRKGRRAACVTDPFGHGECLTLRGGGDGAVRNAQQDDLGRVLPQLDAALGEPTRPRPITLTLSIRIRSSSGTDTGLRGV